MFGPIAQWLEQQTHNLLVTGSNPVGATNMKTKIDWLNQINYYYNQIIKYSNFNYYKDMYNYSINQYNLINDYDNYTQLEIF